MRLHAFRIRIWAASWILLLPAVQAQDAAVLVGRILDAATGKPMPATVAIGTSGGQIITDNPSFTAGFRCSGTFEKEGPPGETTIVVSRGFDYVAIERRLVLSAGEKRTENIALQRRSPLRHEGWYCGDNHVQMMHGERKIIPEFPYVALAAEAEGLDYVSIAQQWNLPVVTPEAQDRICRRLSSPGWTRARVRSWRVWYSGVRLA